MLFKLELKNNILKKLSSNLLYENSKKTAHEFYKKTYLEDETNDPFEVIKTGSTEANFSVDLTYSILKKKRLTRILRMSD